MVFIDKIRRRPQYLIYPFFGLVILVSGMVAFWPEKAEKFNTYIPENEQVQNFKTELYFNVLNVYGTGTVKKPVSVFLDDKQIYIADVADNDVKILSHASKTIAVISGTGKKQKKNPLNYPNAIAPLGKENLLVTESGEKRVLLYKKDSTYIKIIDVAEIKKPGTAVAKDDKVYIADLEAHDIKVLNDKGKVVKTIGTPINGHEILKYPQGLAFDKDGNLWVADGGNNRIVAFDKEGLFLKSFRGKENGGTPFSMVKGLAILKGRYLAVSDPTVNKVRIFDINSNLKEVANLGGTGKAKGKFIYPMGLFVDAKDHLYVADRGNGRIQEFGLK